MSSSSRLPEAVHRKPNVAASVEVEAFPTLDGDGGGVGGEAGVEASLAIAAKTDLTVGPVMATCRQGMQSSEMAAVASGCRDAHNAGARGGTNGAAAPPQELTLPRDGRCLVRSMPEAPRMASNPLARKLGVSAMEASSLNALA
eukprot:scaffold290226_cov31-Tisochrysis_lutea.AAC.3